MQLEACLVCDSASDYNGMLCLLGARDTLLAPKAPCVHPHCAIVVRLRFERAEEGNHRIKLVLIDEDGRPVGPHVDNEHFIRVPEERGNTVANLILGMNNLILPRFGVYHFDLLVDGELKCRVPIYLVQVQLPPGRPAATG
jgi:hypothetical protein